MKQIILAAAAVAALVAAAPASAAVTVTDRIGMNGSADIFFTWAGGMANPFSVEVAPGANNGLADPQIYLFRDDGSGSGGLTGGLVEGNNNGGTGSDALISRRLAAGNYVLSVGSFRFTEAEARSGQADFTPMMRRFVATFADGTTNTNVTTAPVAAAGVPEPATWGPMLLGSAMVGAGLRQRRRAAVTFA